MTSGFTNTINASLGGGDSKIAYPLQLIGSRQGRYDGEFDNGNGADIHTYTITSTDATVGGPILWSGAGSVYGNWYFDYGGWGIDAVLSVTHKDASNNTIKSARPIDLHQPADAVYRAVQGFMAGVYIDGPFTTGDKLVVRVTGNAYWFASTGVKWAVYGSNFYRKNVNASPTRTGGAAGSAFFH